MPAGRERSVEGAGDPGGARGLPQVELADLVAAVDAELGVDVLGWASRVVRKPTRWTVIVLIVALWATNAMASTRVSRGARADRGGAFALWLLDDEIRPPGCGSSSGQRDR
jgi:hypothetical protein